MPIEELMYHLRYRASLQGASERRDSRRVGQVWWRWQGLLFGCYLVLHICAARPGQADTFQEALAQAYRSNPLLHAARAQLHAVDEQVPQALSNWRPSMLAIPETGKKYEESTYTYATRGANLTPWNIRTTIRQNLYNGGQTVAAVKRAEAEVQASRVRLLATEQQILFEAGAVYSDVVRDRAVLELNKNSERVLTRQLEVTRERFATGEVTRTDVAQAESRLSRTIAERVAAQGRLDNSHAAYQNIIGNPPGSLRPTSPLDDLPGSLDEAIATARMSSPEVIAARFAVRAAAATIDKIRGQLLPSLDLEASLGRRESASSTEIRNFATEISARLTIPLYQQGAVSSQVREAKHIHRQRVLELDAAVRKAIQEATQAWKNLMSARARIAAFRAEIQAASVALDGVVQEEQQVGSRTILDVLDAEQELLDARSNLAMATRNEIVASLELRQVVGTLTVQALALPVRLYDPEANYRRVRGKWWGIGIPNEDP